MYWKAIRFAIFTFLEQSIQLSQGKELGSHFPEFHPVNPVTQNHPTTTVNQKRFSGARKIVGIESNTNDFELRRATRVT